jgi:RHS repeat-associated protein
VASGTYTTGASVAVKVKISGTTLTAWVGTGDPKISTTDSDLTAGGFALASHKAEYSNVVVFYDANANNAYDSDTDNLVVNETFSGTAITPTHDDAGNLTNDGTYKYTYDAWNRLVKVTLQDASKVVQVAEYDGLGRRIRKVVTNAGDLDGTTVYYYNGQQMIETRDGSGNVLMQVIHGTRYIDEVVQLFLKDAGRVYVHQDANYNVTTLTDITGRVLERYFYSPYGQLEAVISSHPFDYDDDGDVDEDDASMIDADCSGDYSGDCRRLDADGDRDVDGDDHATIAAYVAGLSGDTTWTRVPSRPRSRLGNPFAHQGLPLDAEIASYQNRARQYNPGLKRFMQRDPLALVQEADYGYQDGLSLYQYVRNDPLHQLDAYGTRTCGGWQRTGAAAPTVWGSIASGGSLITCWWKQCQNWSRCCVATWPAWWTVIEPATTCTNPVTRIYGPNTTPPAPTPPPAPGPALDAWCATTPNPLPPSVKPPFPPP